MLKRDLRIGMFLKGLDETVYEVIENDKLKSLTHKCSVPLSEFNEYLESRGYFSSIRCQIEVPLCVHEKLNGEIVQHKTNQDVFAIYFGESAKKKYDGSAWLSGDMGAGNRAFPDNSRCETYYIESEDGRKLFFGDYCTTKGEDYQRLMEVLLINLETNTKTICSEKYLKKNFNLIR